MDEADPYRSPVAEIVAPKISDAESDRRAHIGAESSIKTLGLLYGLWGVVSLFVVSSTFGIDGAFEESAKWFGLGVCSITAAIGCHYLKAWARLPAGIVSGLGLFYFPVGTLFNIYFLFLIFGARGARVLRWDYRQVIATTPHVSVTTSIAVKVLLAILLGIIGIMVYLAFAEN